MKGHLQTSMEVWVDKNMFKYESGQMKDTLNTRMKDKLRPAFTKHTCRDREV